MSYKISYSSQSLTSYMQGAIIAPDKKFEAIQTTDGHSLLFSIGTDNIFYLTAEMPEQPTGWKRFDLSSVLSANFPAGTVITAKTFDLSQDFNTGKFTAALALTADDDDYLYIADAYTQDGNGNITLNWQNVPFNAANKSYSSICINNIYIKQTAGIPLIVVDILPDTNNGIERYYIVSTDIASELKTQQGLTVAVGWYLYSLPINMDGAAVDICAGRKASEIVDGIYTCGKVANVSSIFYQEIFNPYNPNSPGSASQLLFPKAATPTCIASTPSAATKSTASVTYTDLYAATDEGDLYLFKANNQNNNATGLWLMNSDLFKQLTQLFAYTTGTTVVVWGLNRNQQIFYTQCPIASVSNSASWSYPLPIGSQVEQISPYVNKVNGGNTYFAQIGTDTLKKVFQDPITTCWTTQDIVLPVSSDTKAQAFDCYMTRLTVTNDDNSFVGNAPIKISSSYRVPVFINNHYYVLDTTPILINADNTGGIKVVQQIVNIQCAMLIVESPNGDGSLVINPMDTSAQKIATLNTPKSLSTAQVTDDNGNITGYLVDQNTSDDDLNTAAASIQSLSDAYNNYNTPTAGTQTSAKQVHTRPTFNFNPATTKVYQLSVHPLHRSMQLSAVDDVSSALSSIGNAIVVAAGDLCSWLVNTTEYLIQIVEDTAQKAWNFVATIAGKIYTFVVDCVEKAVAAIEAVFQALKTLAKDLVQFLKLLFSWDNIKQTKDVMKNLALLYLNEGVKCLGVLEVDVSKTIGDIKTSIDNWAGLPSTEDSNPYLTQPVTYSQTQQDTSSAYTSQNTYLNDHLANNIANSTFSSTDQPLVTTIEEVIETFLNALKSEGIAIENAMDTFYDQIVKNDAYKTMSFGDLLQKIVAIIADLILDSIDVVMTALIDLLMSLAEAFIAFLDQPIRIPVVSDILEAAFGFENQLSLLDIICYTLAIPGTILYEILNNTGPFSTDDNYSQRIALANSWQQLMSDFGTTDPSQFDPTKEFWSELLLPESAKNTLFVVSHTFSAFGALLYSILEPMAVSIEISGAKNTFVSTGRTGASLLSSLSFTAAGELAKPCPIQNESVATLSSIITYSSFISSVVFLVAPKFAKTEASKIMISEAKGTVGIILNLLAIAPLGYHVVEVATSKQSRFSVLSYMDESARLCSYIANIAEGIAQIDPAPTTKEIVGLSSSALALISCGIQTVECFTEVLTD